MLHPGSVVGYDRWPPARLAIGHPQPSARLQGEISHVSKIWRGHLSHLITRSLDPQILQNSFHTNQVIYHFTAIAIGGTSITVEGVDANFPGLTMAPWQPGKILTRLRQRCLEPTAFESLSKSVSPCFTMHHSELSKMHGNTMDNKHAGSKVVNGTV
jgi:hypothetical protein